jgi:hypothetical protein
MFGFKGNSRLTKNSAFRVSREVVAALFWLYLITKLFVFDIDVFLISHAAPNLDWLLHYKLVALLALLAILWMCLGHLGFFASLGFILIYPVLVLIRVAKPTLIAIVRRWAVWLLFSPVILTAVKRVRSTFFLYVLALVSALAIGVQRNRWVLVASMGGLALFLGVHLWRSLRKAYSLPMFDQLTKGVRTVRRAVEAGSLDQSPTSKAESVGESNISSKKTQEPSHLTNLYMYHSLADLVAARLQKLLRARVVDLYLISSWFYTGILTVIVFGWIYWGLHRADPSSFINSPNVGLWGFIGYSFERLAPGDLSQLKPATPWAIGLSYVEAVCGVLILIILAFTFLTAAREAYREGAQEFASELQLTAEAVEKRVLSAYRLTLEQLEMAILEKNRAVVDALRKMRGLPALPTPKK